MAREYIPLSVPNLKGNELDYVIDAVKTEWVSSGGSYINDFEAKIAEYVGVEEAVAVQSGTAALHLSLMEAGVEYGEEVIAPTLTFIAAVNPIRYCGAEPVFMDCDDSLCMDPVKLEKFLHEECDFEDGVVINKETSKRIRALVVVHVFGNLTEM
ncbi:aminotransferase class I/II-fold pyridoxal phosphate-dependent enzyme, partial [Jeotgalibaca porci]|uniref:aminotransferase class I/II-fold pyridoxal phosphate-dependent enzyme n=1 Tax=Jeotgalibaca porci TaxID=1868793 RepID=UPI00359F58C8